MNIRKNKMPKTKNPELKVKSKNNKEYYQTTIDATKKHNKDNYDLMSFRMPKGGKDSLKAYLEQRKQEEPDNPKYSTFYAFINTLINEEMQQNTLKEAEKSDTI